MEKWPGWSLSEIDKKRHQALKEFIDYVNEEDFYNELNELTEWGDERIHHFSPETKYTIEHWRKTLSQVLLEEQFPFNTVREGISLRDRISLCIGIFDRLWNVADSAIYAYRDNRARQINSYIDSASVRGCLDHPTDWKPVLFTTIDNDPLLAWWVAWEKAFPYSNKGQYRPWGEFAGDDDPKNEKSKQAFLNTIINDTLMQEVLSSLKEKERKDAEAAWRSLEWRDAKSGFWKIIQPVTKNLGWASQTIDLYKVIDTLSHKQSYTLYDRKEWTIFDHCETNEDWTVSTYTFSWPTASEIADLDRLIDQKKLYMVSLFMPPFKIQNANDIKEHDIIASNEKIACHKNFIPLVMHIVWTMVLQLYMHETSHSIDDDAFFAPFIPDKKKQVDYQKHIKHKKLMDNYLKKIQLRGLYEDYYKNLDAGDDFDLKRPRCYSDVIHQTFEESVLMCCNNVCTELESLIEDNPSFEKTFDAYLQTFDIENPFPSNLSTEKRWEVYHMFEELFREFWLYSTVETRNSFDRDYTISKSTKNLSVDPPQFTKLYHEVCDLKEELMANIKKGFIDGDNWLLSKSLSEYFQTFSPLNKKNSAVKNFWEYLEIILNDEVRRIYYESFEQTEGIDPDIADDLADLWYLEIDDDDIQDITHTIESFSIYKKISDSSSNSKKEIREIQEREILYFPDSVDPNVSVDNQSDLYLTSAKFDSYVDKQWRVCFKSHEYAPLSHTSLSSHIEEHYNALRKKYYTASDQDNDYKQLDFDAMHTITETIIKKAIQTYLLDTVYKNTHRNNTHGNNTTTYANQWLWHETEAWFYDDRILGQALIDTLWKVDTMQYLLMNKSPIRVKKTYQHSMEYLWESIDAENYFDFYDLNSFLAYIVDETATTVSKTLEHPLNIKYNDALNEYHREIPKSLSTSLPQKTQKTDNEIMFDALECSLWEVIWRLRAQLSEKMIVENLDITTETIYLDDLLK